MSASHIDGFAMHDLEPMMQAAGAAHAAGRLAEAEQLYYQVLATDPRRIDAQCGLGVLLSQTRRYAEALAHLPENVVMKSGSTLLLVALAGARLGTGDATGAAAAAEKATAIDRHCAEAHNTLGAARLAQNRIVDAVLALKEALKVRPAYPEAYYNLGKTLQAADLPQEALGMYDAALKSQPGYAEAWLNRGFALRDLKKLDDAASSFRKALTCRPGFAEAMHNLGVTLAEQGHAAMGVGWLKRAVAADPANAAAHSALVYLMMFDPACDAAALVAEARQWNTQHAAGLAGTGKDAKFANRRDAHRKLKIGYVSPDFRGHAECRFLLPLLQNHDRQQYEIHCYSSVCKPDDVTAQIQALADAWHGVRQLTDAQLAARIGADAIDVLVDLTMHMEDNRLGVFARRAAPLQVSWLAYPGVTGLAAMDAHLTDRHLWPPTATHAMGSERPLYLRDSWFCYQMPPDMPDVADLPALSTGTVTFGSLNTYRKVSKEVLELWAKTLGAVADAGTKCRLLLVTPEGSHRQEALTFFKLRGIDEERIELVAPLPFAQYVALCARVDIGLDTFPHAGATTTMDLLNMGVPVLSLKWPTPAGRLGESLLTTAGLEEWVAGNAEEFVEKAVAWTRNLPRLANVRAGLREKVARSPLMDAPRFARAFEGALREAWQAWCSQNP